MSSDFAAITWNTDIYSSGTATPTITTTLNVHAPGLYQAGMFVWLTTVGAATLNSYRNFKLQYVDRRGASLNDQVTLNWQQTTLEAVTGVAATLHAVFPVYTPSFPGAGLRGYV